MTIPLPLAAEPQDMVPVLHIESRITPGDLGDQNRRDIAHLEQRLGDALRQNAALVERAADLERSAILWADWYEAALLRLAGARESLRFNHD
jgi:hypothetical protein